jgi:hypothetical protein
MYNSSTFLSWSNQAFFFIFGGHMSNSPLQSSGSISQRGLLSLVMLLFSVGGLSIAFLAGAKMVFDILSMGLENSLIGLPMKVIVVGLAYTVGWATSMLAIRVYGNLVLPFIINLFIWGCLIGICTLYLLILQRLYDQQYTEFKFIAYVMIMAAGLFALVGLHLIIEGHNLRPLALPLLIINLTQLGLIVLRYVFIPGAQASSLFNDIIFFVGMSAFSIFMLAHIGLLAPLRKRLTNYFDRNSVAIRTED